MHVQKYCIFFTRVFTFKSESEMQFIEIITLMEVDTYEANMWKKSLS